MEECENPKSISILIRGGTRHVVEDVERAVKNSLNVLKNTVEDPFIVPGAGAIEIEISKHIMDYAKSISTRESIAVEAFSKSIEAIPITLAENTGIEPMEISSKIALET